MIQHLYLVHVHVHVQQVKMFIQLRPNVLIHSHTYVCLHQAFAIVTAVPYFAGSTLVQIHPSNGTSCTLDVQASPVLVLTC